MGADVNLVEIRRNWLLQAISRLVVEKVAPVNCAQVHHRGQLVEKVFVSSFLHEEVNKTAMNNTFANYIS